MPVTWPTVDRVGGVTEPWIHDRECRAPFFEPRAEGARPGSLQELGLDRGANVVVRHVGRRLPRLHGRHVPAVLGLDGPDDRPYLGLEERQLEWTGELAPVNLAEIAAERPSAGVDGVLRGELGKRRTAPQLAHDPTCRGFVGQEDMTNAAGLPDPVPVEVAFVVGAYVAVRDRHVGRHAFEQMPDWLPNVRPSRATDTGRVGLEGKDLLGHQLAGDEAAHVVEGPAVVGRQLPGERSASQALDPPVQTRTRDDAVTDDRHDVARPDRGQPFTPPTVIPSMKNRWKKTNKMMIGRTMSVAAAISRL